MTAKPWYSYTNAYTWDFGQYTDPDGNFLKPDANFGVPDGVPITALLSGTVTGINTPGNTSASPAWGQVVTVKLDQPWNSAAQYAAYLHLGSINVQEGQHVAAGDTIGVAGADSMGEHYRTGFAFQSGPYYGFGSGFSTPGNSALSPNTLIQEANSGKISIPGGSGVTPGGSTATTSATSSNPLDSISSFFNSISGLTSWLADPVRILKLVVGLLLIGISIFLLLESNPDVQKAEKTLAKVALL
jgi:murein DD-endopeptidase MepM/ murein hydrolase activator NlpD